MSVFRMPSLGSDMEQATLIEWLITPGAPVRHGDVIAVVETDKGAIEIEVFEDGVLGAYLVEVDTEVAVGAPLAEIQTDSEGTSKPLRTSEHAQPKAAHGVDAPPRPTADADVSTLQTTFAPQPTLVSERWASPAARRLAEAETIDLAAIVGSGPGGAIVLADVEQHIQDQPKRSIAAERPMSSTDGMRRAIAAAMTRSKREIPHYYLSDTVDVHPAVDWLSEVNRERAPSDRLLMGALFLKATATALRDYAEFNGVYENETYQASERIHLGTAIAIRGGGLVAPAIHDTDTLSIDELMAQLRDLVARVRAGRFRGSELRDPTMTVSSLGERGVESLYGVIYPPQVACVGFGAVRLRPWVLDDQTVAARRVVTVTLSADHRVSDGRRGALLLDRIGRSLQKPGAL